MIRRAFFQRMAVAVLASAFFDKLPLPAWHGGLPVLHGDGVTDDTEALQAWFNGLPVLDAQANEVRRGGVLIGGTYLMTGSVVLHDWQAYRA